MQATTASSATRTPMPTATMPSRDCLSCRRTLPSDSFAWGGTCRFCDDCRWDGRVTDELRAQAARLARLEYRNRNLRAVRLADRAYRARARMATA